jgi:hypothetical protein
MTGEEARQAAVAVLRGRSTAHSLSIKALSASDGIPALNLHPFPLARLPSPPCRPPDGFSPQMHRCCNPAILGLGPRNTD